MQLSIPQIRGVGDWSLRAAHGPIGVDVGARSVRAVQVSRKRGAVSISAAATLPRPGMTGALSKDPAERQAAEDAAMQALARRLGDMLARQGFRGREIVLAAPAEQVHSDLLDLPPRSSGAPLAEIARAELGRTAGMENTAYEFACWELPSPARSGAGTAMMAVALRHADADRLLNNFAAAGLQCRALDVEALACARACASRAVAEGSTAVLDFGWSRANLVVMHDSTVIYQRTLAESGLQSLHRAIASRLDVTDEVVDFALNRIGLSNATSENQAGGSVDEIDPGEAARVRAMVVRHVDGLTAELKASFSFAAHRYQDFPIRQLLVAGEGALIAGLPEGLSSRAGVPAGLWRPNNVGGCRRDLLERCEDPSLLMALGLALYEGE